MAVDLDALAKELTEAGFYAIPDPDNGSGLLVFESEQSCEDGDEWLTFSKWGRLNVSIVDVWRWEAVNVIRKHVEGS